MNNDLCVSTGQEAVSESAESNITDAVSDEKMEGNYPLPFYIHKGTNYNKTLGSLRDGASPDQLAQLCSLLQRGSAQCLDGIKSNTSETEN